MQVSAGSGRTALGSTSEISEPRCLCHVSRPPLCCPLCFSRVRRAIAAPLPGGAERNFARPSDAAAEAKGPAVAAPGIPYSELTLGVPKESWDGERRVSLSPAALQGLLKAGFKGAIVESGAGVGARFTVSPITTQQRQRA